MDAADEELASISPRLAEDKGRGEGCEEDDEHDGDAGDKTAMEEGSIP